jgi:YrbI family 3-deoxy-D-manno-octulosonate 8-phosphate phosphatase
VSVVAIIPASGGSPGVKGKYLQRVGGVSLVVRAIQSAQGAESIDRILVSTDDDAIAAEAIAAGAEVVRRPASEFADSESAVLHAMDSVGRIPRISVVVLIQATSPFIDPFDLDCAVGRVRAGECDVALAAVETHSFLWTSTGDGAVGVNHDRTVRSSGRDCEAQYRETGAFYVMRAAGFRQAGFRLFGRVEVAIVDRTRALEIDEPGDLVVARSLAPLFERPEAIDIDALVTDFDGVHTDDRVSIGGDGMERITASRADGIGVDMLRKAGYPLLILSRETNRVVTARGRKLGVEVRQGVEVKATVLAAWAKTRGIELSRIAYVGNDINDVGCMEIVGWPIAVADAHPEVLAVARVVLTQHGGHGAIREVAERILLAADSAGLRHREDRHKVGTARDMDSTYS